MTITNEIRVQMKESMTKRGFTTCSNFILFQGKFIAVTIDEIMDKKFLGQYIITAPINIR